MCVSARVGERDLLGGDGEVVRDLKVEVRRAGLFPLRTARIGKTCGAEGKRGIGEDVSIGFMATEGCSDEHIDKLSLGHQLKDDKESLACAKCDILRRSWTYRVP